MRETLADLSGAQPQSLQEIASWNAHVGEALVAHQRTIEEAIAEQRPAPSRFLGLGELEVRQAFARTRAELDRLTILNLVASTEAALRLDYFRRVGKKLKDPLSRAYRAWHRNLNARKRVRPDFDEQGILDVLSRSRMVDPQVIGQFGSACRRGTGSVMAATGSGREFWMR